MLLTRLPVCHRNIRACERQHGHGLSGDFPYTHARVIATRIDPRMASPSHEAMVGVIRQLNTVLNVQFSHDVFQVIFHRIFRDE